MYSLLADIQTLDCPPPIPTPERRWLTSLGVDGEEKMWVLVGMTRGGVEQCGRLACFCRLDAASKKPVTPTTACKFLSEVNLKLFYQTAECSHQHITHTQIWILCHKIKFLNLHNVEYSCSQVCVDIVLCCLHNIASIPGDCKCKNVTCLTEEKDSIHTCTLCPHPSPWQTWMYVHFARSFFPFPLFETIWGVYAGQDKQIKETSPLANRWSCINCSSSRSWKIILVCATMSAWKQNVKLSTETNIVWISSHWHLSFLVEKADNKAGDKKEWMLFNSTVTNITPVLWQPVSHPVWWRARGTSPHHRAPWHANCNSAWEPVYKIKSWLLARGRWILCWTCSFKFVWALKACSKLTRWFIDHSKLQFLKLGPEEFSDCCFLSLWVLMAAWEFFIFQTLLRMSLKSSG